MLGGGRGVVAAAERAAGSAQAQVNPGRSDLETFLAAARARLHGADGFQVAAGRGHRMRGVASAFDVGLGPVIAGRHLLVPMAILVLVGDAGGLSRNALLLHGALRRLAGAVVRREGFGINPVDPVGPAAVMLDDLVGDSGHASLLLRLAAVGSGERI